MHRPANRPRLSSHRHPGCDDVTEQTATDCKRDDRLPWPFPYIAATHPRPSTGSGADGNRDRACRKAVAPSLIRPSLTARAPSRVRLMARIFLLKPQAPAAAAPSPARVKADEEPSAALRSSTTYTSFWCTGEAVDQRGRLTSSLTAHQAGRRLWVGAFWARESGQ